MPTTTQLRFCQQVDERYSRIPTHHVEESFIPLHSISLRFGLYMLQHPQMNPMNDVVRPQMPVRRRPHRMLIPRRTFQPRPASGQRSQRKLSLLRNEVAVQMRRLATSQQNGWPQVLLTVPLSTKPPRNSASPQSTGILCAKFPSSLESSISISAAWPTKSHLPVPPPHPPRRTGFRRSTKISFQTSTLRAAFPEAPQRADPAAAPKPFRAFPESAQSTLRFAYRTGTPRQKTATPARAAPSRPCIHSRAKSCFFSSLLLCVPLRSQRRCIIFFSSLCSPCPQ